MFNPEPWHRDPPEPQVDGVWVCARCGETIPGDERCLKLSEDEIYCMDCVKELTEYAPYKEEYR